MTPLAQRIAIAEACGYPAPFEEMGSPNGGHWDLFACDSREVPQYLTDLNAMHEAEKEFFWNGCLSDKYTQYLNELEKVTRTVNATTQQWDFTHATAAQRAEAFLRTIGKWDDTK